MEGSYEQYKTSAETENEDLVDVIDAAIHAMKQTLKTRGCEKASLSDLIRLLQLRRELEGDRPRQVNARWIDEECQSLND